MMPGEQIVEVMRDPTHQPADHFHLLGFAQSLLSPFALGDVLSHADGELGLAVRPAYQ